MYSSAAHSERRSGITKRAVMNDVVRIAECFGGRGQNSTAGISRFPGKYTVVVLNLHYFLLKPNKSSFTLSVK